MTAPAQNLACCFERLLFDSFVIPWTVAHQLLCPWDFPGKNMGVGCHFLLQGIFPTQGANPCLLLAGGFFTTEPPGKPLKEDMFK